jgi:hypothetical protein
MHSHGDGFSTEAEPLVTQGTVCCNVQILCAKFVLRIVLSMDCDYFIDPVQSKSNLIRPYRTNSYRAVNTLRLGYKTRTCSIVTGMSSDAGGM